MQRISSVVFATFLALPAPAQEPQSFPGGTEMVAVDVRVVDDDGHPVSDLTAGDFTVEIDGKPRPVVSAQFVDLRATTATTPGGTGAPPPAPPPRRRGGRRRPPLRRRPTPAPGTWSSWWTAAACRLAPSASPGWP
jgi:hypothetical protein